ncbi:MAG: putative spermidine/putrescine transport system ATP-binding protein [Thermoplasmata archaeon]|jgi:ABC-type Fe3+/spermidine/putrescine transport system ATPase subunit|nr:putative spermidine/putrescine transport system ATP-binding protein [Thermoplasmata archaeon]
MAAVALQGVARRYDDFALHPTSLDLPARSFTVLLGPSGSGKTTLLRMIAGLERPDAGDITIGGRDVTALPPEARGVGLVFQEGALFPHLDVAGNVGFGLRVQGVPARERATRVDEALALVGLAGFGARKVARLSGGERQRVALARALAPRPAVVLFDEPLASLDRALREELRVTLRRVHDEAGLTSVLVTHDREEALALADRLVLMREGRVVEEGAPRAMFEQPRTAFAARFLGAANVIGDKLVPPDAIRLTEDARGDAVVLARRFAGFHEEARVRLADGTEIDARGAVGTLPAAGAKVRVAWDEARARKPQPADPRD